MEFGILAVAKPVAAATAPVKGAGGGYEMLIMTVGMMAVLWFVMIAPQKKQQKKRDQMLKSMKKGDKVITIGGMHGEITEIDDEDVKLRIADKTEVKYTRSSIAKIKG